MSFKLTIRIVATVLTLGLGGAGCAHTASRGPATGPAPTGLETALVLAPNQGVVTLLGTNDIHGSFALSSWFSGYVAATRAHLSHTYGNRSSLLLLDAGDAAQGTLLSNYSEGELAVKIMNAIGYTAGIPGNHAYDFGPKDWKVDKCAPSDAKCDPLETLKTFSSLAKFPVLAANVKTKATPSKNLPYLPPYTLIDFMGRKIAVIGLDNSQTPSTTIAENIAGLTFGSGKGEELAAIVEKLWTATDPAQQADVFILVMHEGDSDKDATMGNYLSTLPRRSTGEPLVDAAIAGHSHATNDAIAGEVPYIQSGANGELFGLVQLVVEKDPTTGRLSVARDRTRKKASIPIQGQAGGFLGEAVNQDPVVDQLFREASAAVAGMAKEPIATALGPITMLNPGAGDIRWSDAPVGSLIADMMKKANGAEVALINSGDIRRSAQLKNGFPKGDILFEDLFNLVPKNLSLMQVSAMPVKALIANIKASTESCGHRGALQISGMKLVFRRHCKEFAPGEKDPNDGIDPDAQLLKVILDSGEVLYESKSGVEKYSRATARVATTDFVMTGGAGYRAFQSLTADAGDSDLRDEVTKQLKAVNQLDPVTYAVGRYINCEEGPTTASPACGP